MVSMPRRLASSKARSRLPELPLVDSPTAMSFRPPNAASCRANTTSTPMSLHSAVTTDVSLASPNAGSGGASLPLTEPGLRNRVASCWASVALPPLPNANSRPPAPNRVATARAQSASRAPSRAATVRRSSSISCALATVESRTWVSTTDRSEVSEYRNGYSDSNSLMSRPHHRDGLPGVHQDRVTHPGRHQGYADRLLARAGVDHRHLVRQQPHHRDRHGRVRTGDADLADALRQLAHVITPGPSTPGCSKNTCTSSHST